MTKQRIIKIAKEMAEFSEEDNGKLCCANCKFNKSGKCIAHDNIAFDVTPDSGCSFFLMGEYKP